MSASKRTWTKYERQALNDSTGGRVLLEGRSPEVAGSPGGTHVAVSSLALPTDVKPKNPDEPDRVVRVFRVDAASRGELVQEHREPHALNVSKGLAVSDDAVVVFGVPGGLKVCRPGAPARVLDAHACPAFDDEQRLVAGVFETSGGAVARYDREGALRSKHPFAFGNLPVVPLRTGDVFGLSGWLGEDGSVTPLGREWQTPLVSAGGVIFSRPVEGAGETVLLTRQGERTTFPDSLCAASADGQYAISIRYPPTEEAHAQRKSQYDARRIELVDLRGGARRALTAVGFPQGKVLCWPKGEAMLLAWDGEVFWYDATRDELKTAQPLRPRAAAWAGARCFTAHADGVRAGGAGDDVARVSATELTVTPSGGAVLASGAQRSLLDERLAVLADLGSQRSVSFVANTHVLLVALDDAVWLQPIAGGGAKQVSAGVKSAVGLPDGYLLAFDKRIDRCAPDGSVVATWALSAKSPKSLKPEAITWATSTGESLLILSGRRLFRLSSGGAIAALLTKVEKMLGASGSAYEGRFRQVSPGAGTTCAVIASSPVGTWTSVLVCDLDSDDVLGWAGAYEPAPLAIDWHDGKVRVADAWGRTHALMP